MATNLHVLFKPLPFLVSNAHFWLRHRCFLRVSPKPSSCGCIFPLWHRCFPLDFTGALFFVPPWDSAFFAFCLNFVFTCGQLHAFAKIWCSTSLLAVADIASLTPLFSWLKGVPPGINPSSRQQKKEITRHPTKSGRDPTAKRLGPGIGTFLWPAGALRVFGTTLTLIMEAPTGRYVGSSTPSHVLWPSVMWTNGSVVHGVQTRGARHIVTHAFRRGVVGTWSPAFCLCRTLPSVELRTHISFPWGPGSEHPCWLPASPDASDASDVIQRCPSQVTQALKWTLLTCIHYAQTISWLEDLLCA